MLSRRELLYGVGCAGSSLTFQGVPLGHNRRFRRPPISVFTKELQSLSFERLAEVVNGLGFAGIELPVRKRGHIEPAAAAEQLPQAVAAFKKAGIELTILTSDISHPEQAHADRVLRTAAKLGVKRYRVGWFRYKAGRSVLKQIDELRPKVRELAAFNREIGMQGLLQNHSGAQFVGSAIWDYQRLLEDVAPSEVGVAFDLGHATIEGGKTWPNHVDVIWPHVRAIYAKDFVWRSRKTAWVPFGTGNTNLKFYERIGREGFDGPISLHVEYERHSTVEKHTGLLKRDLAVLAKRLGRK